jgi:hypothetical protein
MDQALRQNLILQHTGISPEKIVFRLILKRFFRIDPRVRKEPLRQAQANRRVLQESPVAGGHLGG